MSFQVDKDLMVAMRDGTEQATDVWRPSGLDAAPTPLEQPSRLVLPVIRR